MNKVFIILCLSLLSLTLILFKKYKEANNKRIILFFIFFLSVNIFSLVYIFSAFIQINNKLFSSFIQKNNYTRGDILTQDNNILVTNMFVYDVFLELARMPSKKKITRDNKKTFISDKRLKLNFINNYADFLNIKKEVLIKRFFSDKKEVIIKRNVDILTYQKLKKVKKLYSLRFKKKSKRVNFSSIVPSSLLGYVNREKLYDVFINLDNISLKMKKKVYEKITILLKNKVYEKKLLYEKLSFNDKGKLKIAQNIKSSVAQIILNLSKKLSLPISFELSPHFGLSGIERSFNDYLSPKNNYHRKNGHNITLTLNHSIQEIIYKEFEELSHQYDFKLGMALMMNPDNGNILGYVEFFHPKYENKNKAFSSYISQVPYEFGSVIKPISLASILQYNKDLSLNTKVFCENGSWRYNNAVLRDANRSYNYLTIREVMEKSSNIGMAKLSLQLGKKRFYSMLKRFGFGNKIKFPLKTTRGILTNVKNWDPLSLSRFSIGQGFSSSLLQLVTAYCSLANGGKRVYPNLVLKIGPEIYNHNLLTQEQRIIEKEVALKTIISMKGVVSRGTGKKAFINGINIIGKTGTGQKWINEKNEYSHNKHIISFLGFPKLMKSKFVLAVAIDEPPKNITSSLTASLFKSITKKSLSYIQ